MSFVVDGSEWHFDGATDEQIYRTVDAFLELVQTSRERGEEVWIGEDFQTRPMRDGLDLWSLFGGLGFDSRPIELLQELAGWLTSARYYVDLEDWPEAWLESSKISIDGGPEKENPDVAWVHHHTLAEKTYACLTLQRTGHLPSKSDAGEVNIFFVNTEDLRRQFWRHAITVRGDSLSTLIGFAGHAFPNLYFFGDSLDDLKNLEGGYHALRDEIRETLAVLNDDGDWVFSCRAPALLPAETRVPNSEGEVSNQLIQKRFQARGLDVAPEKPDVYQNGKTRRARQIEIGSETLYCGWHVKLEPHRNRIYIHKPVPVTENRLVIGIVHRHLPLP